MRTLALILPFLVVACSTPAPAPAPDATKADEATPGEGAAEMVENVDEADEIPPGEVPGMEADPEKTAAAMMTIGQLEEAKGLVRGMMPKDAMMKAVEPVLGEPQSKSDAEVTWIAKEGDSCKVLKVTLMGDMVGNANIEDTDCPAGEAE